MRLISRLLKGTAVFFAFLFAAASFLPLTASAKGSGSKTNASIIYEEKVDRFDIAMVFDNSGSMFQDNRTRWCHAKFAMEIFASMLDYGNGGDTLAIFPMWHVVTDGSKPVPPENAKTNTDPYKAKPGEKVEIKSIQDIDLITKMYTEYGGGTPFDAVKSAAAYLNGLNAGEGREKWLIILTDGAFNNMSNLDRAINELNLQDGVKIQMLNIIDNNKSEGVSYLTPVDGKVFVNTTNGNQIKDALVDICNRIFQRNELKAAENKTTFELPLSMKKLIVFVQGEGAQIKGLKDEVGNLVPMSDENVKPRQYSEYDVGRIAGTTKHNVDKTLFGQVCTFESCKKGKYTLELNSENATNIQYFYTPDVTVEITLTDEEGTPITERTEVRPGKYQLTCKIVDCNDPEKKDISDSELLGNDLDYSIRVENNGNVKDYTSNGVFIDLEEGDASIKIRVSYLKNRYSITNEDSPMSIGFTVKAEMTTAEPTTTTPPTTEPPEPKPKLILKVEKEGYYVLKDHENWEPLRVTVKLQEDEGEEERDLTDAELNTLTIEIESEDPGVNSSHYKLQTGESAFDITLCVNKDGEYHEPGTGMQSFTVKCSLPVKYEAKSGGEGASAAKVIEAEGKTSGNLTFGTMNKIVRDLIKVIIAGGVITLFVLFMSQKALPSRISKENFRFEVHHRAIGAAIGVQYDRRSKKISIQSPQTQNPEDKCQISLLLYPVSRRWTPSRRRQIGIRGINGASNGVTNVTVSGVSFIRDNGKLVVKGQDPNAPLQITGTSHNIRVNAHASLLTGTVESK